MRQGDKAFTLCNATPTAADHKRENSSSSSGEDHPSQSSSGGKELKGVLSESIYSTSQFIPLLQTQEQSSVRINMTGGAGH